MHRLIVILGPTASGKSSLGVRLAKKFHGVVISADSRQVYRGLDLGTGKITRREMAGVPHYLLDVASPRGQYSVSRYVRDVRRVVDTLPPTTPIFLVGGSPFYIEALTQPKSFSPVPPQPELRRRLSTWTSDRLLARLQRLDPQRAAVIDRQNRRRLIRAIEIASDQHTPQPIVRPDFQMMKIGIAIDKPQLFRNIERRLDQRMRHGMLREVQRLHQAGLSWKKLDALGLEYRYLARLAQRQVTRDQAVTELTSAIKDFAKRQMTWWKRDQSIHWIRTTAAAQRLVQNFLQ